MTNKNQNEWCFACGPQNPIGLHLNFSEQDEVYRTTFVGTEAYQGYEGILHGGIVSTLLDEVMARYIYSLGVQAVTARLDIRYRQPTPIGKKLLISGKIERQRGRMYEMSGKIELEDGTVTAEGRATVMVVESNKGE